MEPTKKESEGDMLVIHRVAEPKRAKGLRVIWERMGAVEVGSVEEAIRIEKEGKLAFIDETNGGENCISQEERDKLFAWDRISEWPHSCDMEYIQAEVKHFCQASKAWYELRWEAARTADTVEMAYEDGAFWAREVKNNFLILEIPRIIAQHEPFEECKCDKAAKMKAIKRLLGLESIQQGSIESRIQIDGRYTDLEQLLGLNPKAPKEPTIWVP